MSWPSDYADSIEISNITIKSSKVIASIKLSIGTLQRNFDLAKQKSKEATLPLDSEQARPRLPSSTTLIVKVRLEGLFTSKKTFEINRQDLLSNPDTVHRGEYRTNMNEVELVIGFVLIPQTPLREAPVATFTGLRSTTDEIFELCPRFRVLVIGRTGAGKTSLIKNTFGVTDAIVSHGVVGECDINDELYSSDENKRFVLHDSKGFEPGDEGNFDTVIKFLNDRKAKPDIKDQVHAVWLCFGIPIDGDRLFETGAEVFLQSLSERKLGKMPIIAIFTKYDKLVDHFLFYDSSVTGLDEANAKAKAKLNELCVKPFKEQIVKQTNIPDIPVSTEEGYEETLHRLTQLTTDLVGRYLTEDVAVLSAVAQQVSPTVKLNAIIAVGRKRYWKGLASTMNLPGNEPEIVLQNIHQDIVSIWNLQDPKKLLDSKEFKALVAGIVTDPDAMSMKEMGTSLSILAALAGVVSALAGPVAPIVMPIAAAFVVGHWTILLLKQANIALQRLMSYIVALTIIMQMVFAITTSTKNVVSCRLIKVAMKTFLQSSHRVIIHSAIKEHLQRPAAAFGRDAALQKITELIESSRISADDMAKIRTIMKDFDVNNDEPW